MLNSSVKIDKLNKYYNNLHVLKDISLNIEKGDIFGIIGRSGAGKSTLLRNINGLEGFDSGNIFINGKIVDYNNEHELRILRKNISMIFQHFSLITRSNVFDNIAIPMKLWGEKKEMIDSRVREIAKLVEIEHLLENYPNKLSGGQQQRVGIARALVNKPNIILADEATSALDPNTIFSILELLKKINMELGITIIIVTHQIEVVKDICNKIAIINNGTIVECGYTDHIFYKESEELLQFVNRQNKWIPHNESCQYQIIFTNQNNRSCILSKFSNLIKEDFEINDASVEFINNTKISKFIVSFNKTNLKLIENAFDELEVKWRRI